MEEKQGGHLAGCISIQRNAQRSDEAELAYWFGVPFWGRGFATEACEVVLIHAGNHWGLRTAFATVRPENLCSARVLRKLGMVREGSYRLAPGDQAGRVSPDLYVVSLAHGPDHRPT